MATIQIDAQKLRVGDVIYDHRNCGTYTITKIIRNRLPNSPQYSVQTIGPAGKGCVFREGELVTILVEEEDDTILLSRSKW